MRIFTKAISITHIKHKHKQSQPQAKKSQPQAKLSENDNYQSTR